MRVGSTNRHADPELIAELRRYARGDGFDEQPVPELDSEAIDFRAASESFAPVRELFRRDLATLRLVTTHQGRTVPTVGGILLFGRERARHFPDAWIQVGRFAGTDKTRILDHGELPGHPVGAIARAVAFAQGHLRRGAEIGAVRREDLWELPPVALREAIVNAVVHADYSQRGAPIRVALFDDRLEVESPGLLPFGLTVEEIGLRFRVTLRMTPVAAPLFDARDQSIVALLSDGAGHSTAEIAGHIGRTPRATRTRLAALTERGFVREVGTGPHDPQRRYYLTGKP